MTPNLNRTQVEPRMKNNIGACGCGCGKEGVLRVKPWRSNGVRCTRDCTCNQCRGRRSREKGDRKAAKARKALGLSGANTRHEEHWRGNLLVESKAGAQVGPILTRYMAAKAQAEASRAIGDHRPFAFIAAPDRGPILVVVEINTVHDFACAVVEDWGRG